MKNRLDRIEEEIDQVRAELLAIRRRLQELNREKVDRDEMYDRKPLFAQ